jgi:ribosome-associated protein
LAVPPSTPQNLDEFPSINSIDLAQTLCGLLDENKAEDIVTIDLKGKTTIADVMIVASGRSGRQVNALAHKLIDYMRETHNLRARVEGLSEGDWVLIDAHDVIIHLFRPEVRQFYALEKMWAQPQPDQAPNTRNI